MSVQARERRWTPKAPLTAHVAAGFGYVLALACLLTAYGLAYVDRSTGSPEDFARIEDRVPGLVPLFIEVHDVVVPATVVIVLGGVALARISHAVTQLSLRGWLGQLTIGIALSVAAWHYGEGVFHAVSLAGGAMCGLLLIASTPYLDQWGDGRHGSERDRPQRDTTRSVRKTKGPIVVPHPDATWDAARGSHVMWDDRARHFLEWDRDAEEWRQLS